MYELKKNGKVFTSKSVGTGPSSYENKNFPGRGLTEVEKQWVKLMSDNISINGKPHQYLSTYRYTCPWLP